MTKHDCNAHTHYADDCTLERLSNLEADNKELRAILTSINAEVMPGEADSVDALKAMMKRLEKLEAVAKHAWDCFDKHLRADLFRDEILTELKDLEK